MRAWALLSLRKEKFMETELLEKNMFRNAGCSREQWMDALRKNVQRLPELERQLLALYFGGGLSLVEIASEMSISQKTADFKIKEARKRVNRWLSQAGFFVSGP